MPTTVVIGKGLSRGVVEVRVRATGDREEIPAVDAVDALVERVRG